MSQKCRGMPSKPMHGPCSLGWLQAGWIRKVQWVNEWAGPIKKIKLLKWTAYNSDVKDKTESGKW